MSGTGKKPSRRLKKKSPLKNNQVRKKNNSVDMKKRDNKKASPKKITAKKSK